VQGISGSDFTTSGATGLTVYGPTAVVFNNPTAAVGSNPFVLTTGSTFTLAGQPVVASIIGTASLRGGTLRLDNSIHNIANRVTDATIVEASGGGIDFVGNASGTTETLGALTFFAGTNTFRVTHASSSAPTVLTFASLSRGGSGGAGQTGNVNFVNVGGAFGTGNNPRIVFGTTAPTVTNGAIAIASSTGYTTVNGTDFATYSASTGVTAVTTTNVSGTLSTSPTVNARLTGSGTISSASNVAFNTFKIDPSGAGQSLTITRSGSLSTTGILLGGAHDFTIQNSGGSGGLTAGAGTRFIHVANPDTTLNLGVSVAPGTLPLVKAGEGFLAFTSTTTAQIADANFAINAGTVRANTTNFPNNLGGLRLRGGVLELTGGAFTRALSNTATGGQVNWTGTSVTDRGSGGFSAFGADASVNIGGASATLTWNSTTNFVADGYALIFGSTKSDARLTFLNPINLGAPLTNQGYALREVRVIDNANSTGDVTTFAGAISGTDSRVELLKTGGGTLELTAANTYVGGTLATGGTLRLAGANGALASANLNFGGGSVFEIDNSASNVSGRLTDAGGPRLTLGGATLRLVGNGSSATSETFDGLTINPGSSFVTATNANATITLGSITRTAAGGTVAFSTTGTINTSAPLTSGIVGGFATVGDEWATKSGSRIVALGTYQTGTSPSGWAATDNVKIGSTAPGTVSANTTINSLNFANAQTLVIDSSRTLTLASGGVLASASGSISGGTLTAGNSAQGSDLVAVVNGSNTFAINSTIADNGGTAVGLTKSGAGTLVLGGANTYTGRTVVGQGTLAGTGTVSGAATVARGAAIRGGTAGTTGTLTVANNLTLEAGATLLVEASRTGSGTANAGKIDVTGAGSVLNLNPGTIPGEAIVIEVANNATNPLQAGEAYNLTLASVATAGNVRLNGSPLAANAVVSPTAYTLKSADFESFSNVSLAIDSTGRNLVLTFTATPVPEPATVLAIAAGALVLGRAVRRRKLTATE
jgi:autotransporter-associated beta strand protein